MFPKIIFISVLSSIIVLFHGFNIIPFISSTSSTDLNNCSISVRNVDFNELFNENNIPTAVFAANDVIALGAMKAIRENNFKIPNDISVIGFNDEETSAYIEPPLTTIHAPAYDMGQHGANLVYVASNLSIKTPLKAKIPCELVVRESCRRI